MSKTQWKNLALSLLATLITILLVIVGTASISLAQTTRIAEYRDVSPTDWYYKPLRNLAERHKCAISFSDGSFRGSNPLTRGQLALQLNTCFDKIVYSLDYYTNGVEKEIERIENLIKDNRI